MDTAAVAVDIGGSHVSVARVQLSDEGRTEADFRSRVPLDSHGSAAEIIATLTTAIRTVPGTNLPVNIAIPGPFDMTAGFGDFEGVDKFENLSGVNLRTALSDALQIPASRIVFLKDSDAYALGEARNGAARDLSAFVCLTLGTGLGSAFVRDGEVIHSGGQIPADGDLFRIQLDGIPIEQLASVRAIEANYYAWSQTSFNMVEICEAARRGELLAISVLQAAMDALGRAVGPRLHGFGAEALVIGGSVAAAADLLFPRLERRLHADGNLPILGIRRAEHDELAALIGAAASGTRPAQ